MSEESKTKELAAAWKNQPEETPVKLDGFMSRRTSELRSATRSEIVMSVVAALFFVTVLAWRFASDPGHFPRLAVAAVAAWAAVTLYCFRDRFRREDSPRKDALAVTCLEYYRKELERRRDHLRNPWLWHGPLLIACATVFAILDGGQYPAFRGLSRVLPLVLMLVGWIGFGLMRRLRQAGELQREINEIEMG